MFAVFFCCPQCHCFKSQFSHSLFNLVSSVLLCHVLFSSLCGFLFSLLLILISFTCSFFVLPPEFVYFSCCPPILSVYQHLFPTAVFFSVIGLLMFIAWIPACIPRMGILCDVCLKKILLLLLVACCHY